MKRQPFLVGGAVLTMVLLAALGGRQATRTPTLEWAAKAPAAPVTIGVLIELGTKDKAPVSWSSRATVTGAKVVGREGYCFRKGDKLIDPDGWEASSHRPMRAQKGNPALNRTLRLNTVGVVLHLSDVGPDASLTIAAPNEELAKVVVPLKDVIAGQTKEIWDGKAIVRRTSVTSPVVTAPTEDDFPAAAYGPDGTLWVAYISYTVRDKDRPDRFLAPISPAFPLGPGYDKQPENFKHLLMPGFTDQLFVKYQRGGRWSEPIAVTGNTEDLVRCAVAVDADGTAWVVYSAHRDGKHTLYGRPIAKKFARDGAAPQAGPEQKILAVAGSSLTPAACTDSQGNVHVACQHWTSEGHARILTAHCRKGVWSADLDGDKIPDHLPGKDGNAWYAALAASGDGRVALAFDVYRHGDYDVYVTEWAAGKPRTYPIATSSKFEARPSIVYDDSGRLWIAYEEGPDHWGKDFGALDERGNPLYNERSVRVACLHEGRLLKPVAELPTSRSKTRSPNEGTLRYAYPQIGVDGKGRLWLTYRQNFPGGFLGTLAGTYWLTFARRLDGDRWTPPMAILRTDGLLDHRPVVLPDAGGGLRIVHNTDGRFSTPEVMDNQIYTSIIDLPGVPIEPKLEAAQPGSKDEKADDAERAALAQIRSFRIDHGGSKYQLLRGEFHRHTELSFDGGADGSVEDFFRYAIDVAGLEWVGLTDHDNGEGREYPWWLTQKFTDAYHTARKFTPMFAYERSCPYPHGHRNCIFTRRGVRTLDRLMEPDPNKRVAGIHADDAKMLFRYLRELDGICASHTSATNMGTDWRDNDPVVEPLVEIYQGDRNSYEYPDAPRAGHEPASGIKPASLGGWKPAGYIDSAFRKGYRFGFQSSSDHFSTHISFCVVLADRNDRQGIFEAMKKRRCYAATESIIADVRCEGHLMGEEFKASGAPKLDIHIVGTAPIQQIAIIKDSEVAQALKPGKVEFKESWTDPNPSPGVHWYYVRVQQSDGELAWTSPMWIDFSK